MEKQVAIPSPPPSNTDGADIIGLGSGIRTGSPHKEPSVCLNCAKLHQETTNGFNGNIKDDAAQPPSVLPKPACLNTQSRIESPVPTTVSNANLTVLETMLVSQVEAPHGGTIKIIQMQRPHAKNALSQQMVRELSHEIETLHHEAYDISSSRPSTRALIITSAVDNIFCGGADLKERATMTLPQTRAFLASLRTVLHRLSALPLPTIACVSGAALGGGLELALACHLRVFAPNGAAALPETRLAIIPGAGGTYRLPRIVGASRALEMVLTGRRVQADEALAIGLCHRLVAMDPARGGARADAGVQRRACLDDGVALARQIAGGGPVAVRAALGVLCGDDDALENAAYEAVLCTEDRDEALQAFLGKRGAVFQGR